MAVVSVDVIVMLFPFGPAWAHVPGGRPPVIGLQSTTPPVMSGRTRKPFTFAGRYLLMLSLFCSRSQGETTFVPLERYPNLPSFTRDEDSVDTTEAASVAGRWKFS